jgi:pilus assembly protein CpaB
MKNFRVVIPILLALVVAGGGSLLVYNWVQKQAVPKQVVQVQNDALPVAVAAVDLPLGTKLEKRMIKQVLFLKESLPPGYSSDPEKIMGRILVVPLKKNEPVIEVKLATESVKTGGVSAVVTPGKRALAVKGDKVIGISGFINPGNRVDVLVTLQDPRDKLERTKLILENILVLATGSQVEKNAKGEPAPVDVYTLEVTPEEGEKMALAAAQGKLQFALRNLTDAEKVLTNGTNIPQTLASLRKAESPPQEQPAATKQTVTTKTKPVQPRSSSHTVEIIKGGKVSKENFSL